MSLKSYYFLFILDISINKLKKENIKFFIIFFNIWTDIDLRISISISLVPLY